MYPVHRSWIGLSAVLVQWLDYVPQKYNNKYIEPYQHLILHAKLEILKRTIFNSGNIICKLEALNSKDYFRFQFE